MVFIEQPHQPAPPGAFRSATIGATSIGSAAIRHFAIPLGTRTVSIRATFGPTFRRSTAFSIRSTPFGSGASLPFWTTFTRTAFGAWSTFALHAGGELFRLLKVDRVASTEPFHQTTQPLSSLGGDLVFRDRAIAVLVEPLEPLQHLSRATRATRTSDPLANRSHQFFASELILAGLFKGLVEHLPDPLGNLVRDFALLQLAILIGIHSLEDLAGIGASTTAGSLRSCRCLRGGIGGVSCQKLFLGQGLVLVLVAAPQQSLEVGPMLFGDFFDGQLAVAVGVELVEQRRRVISLSGPGTSGAEKTQKAPAGPA